MTTAEQQTDELERLAEQVDAAAAAARALEGEASAKALVLREAIEAFHKAGLTRIVQRLKADPRGKELLFELVDDALVYALFSMHGIVRADPAAEAPPNEPGPAMIGLAEVGLSGSAAWLRGPRVEEVPPGRMARMEAEPESILIVNLANRLSAYRNACAHQGRPLDGGIFDAESGTITCPWHGFCFDVASGECLTAPQAQLEPFPLQVRDGVIWVRPAS